MGIKTYRPYTPSRRNMSGYDFAEITKSIQTTGNLDDETAQKLHDAIVEFKKPFDLIK